MFQVMFWFLHWAIAFVVSCTVCSWFLSIRNGIIITEVSALPMNGRLVYSRDQLFTWRPTSVSNDGT